MSIFSSYERSFYFYTPSVIFGSIISYLTDSTIFMPVILFLYFYIMLKNIVYNIKTITSLCQSH